MLQGTKLVSGCRDFQDTDERGIAYHSRSVLKAITPTARE
jgi:hypothetical protein